MKKILAVVLSLMMAMSLVSACAEAAAVTGTWYGDMAGMAATLIINEDGTYVMEVMGEQSPPSSWELSGNQLIMDGGAEGSPVFTYDAAAQTLDADMGGMLLHFTREPVEIWAPAAVIADPALEDFTGKWTAQKVEAMGMMLDVAMAGMDLDLEIEGTLVTMILDMGGESQDTLEGVFGNGVISCVDGESTVTLSLHEDGTLSAAMSASGLTITFYMAQAEEVE